MIDEINKIYEEQTNILNYKSECEAWVDARRRRDWQLIVLCLIGFGLIFVSSPLINTFFEFLIWLIVTFCFLFSFCFVFFVLENENDNLIYKLCQSNTIKEINKKMSLKRKIPAWLVITGLVLVFMLIGFNMPLSKDKLNRPLLESIVRHS